MKVLIVEDEPRLAEALAHIMKEQKYMADVVHDGNDGFSYACTGDYDVIVLDVMLPGMSGFDVAKHLRAEKVSTPILMLTARDEITDKIHGLDYGADDYMTKPFRLAVLGARVSALLRRTKPSAQNLLQIDNFNFDFESMSFANAGILIELRKTEQRLLYLLVTNRVNTVKRSRLLEQVWPDGTEFVDENALSVVISRLRNKLEDDPKNPKYIKTVYGTGYIWAVVS